MKGSPVRVRASASLGNGLYAGVFANALRVRRAISRWGATQGATRGQLASISLRFAEAATAASQALDQRQGRARGCQGSREARESTRFVSALLTRVSLVLLCLLARFSARFRRHRVRSARTSSARLRGSPATG